MKPAALLLVLLSTLTATTAHGLGLSVGVGEACALDEGGSLSGDGDPCTAIDLTPVVEPDGTISFSSNTPQALDEDSLLSISLTGNVGGAHDLTFSFLDNGAPSRFSLVVSVPLVPNLGSDLPFSASFTLSCTSGGSCVQPIPGFGSAGGVTQFDPFDAVVPGFGSLGATPSFTGLPGGGGGGGGFGASGSLGGLAALAALAGGAASSGGVIVAPPTACPAFPTNPVGGPVSSLAAAGDCPDFDAALTVVAIQTPGGGEIINGSTSLNLPEPSTALLTALGFVSLAAAGRRAQR